MVLQLSANFRKETSKLKEQINKLQQEAQNSHATIEKEKRDSSSRAEQDKLAITDLHSQLRNLRLQLEESRLV